MQTTSALPRLMEPALPASSSQGIFKTAMGDIDEAIKTGVLGPPPPDALGGGWKLNWHKFKELFKFYLFGVGKLGIQHRRMALEILRRGEKEPGVRMWRERDFVNIYFKDLARYVLPISTPLCTC